MIENRFENKIIYQIELRTFTTQGTLKAAQKLLPHVKNTGFDIVYLTPVFCADDDTDQRFWSERQKKSGTLNPKNSYRMSDYFNVDEEYGTNEDLKDFIDAAHEFGLLVFLDLVYFHCGPNAVFLTEHPDFVKRDENGAFSLGDWAFPRLNFDNPELREYLWQNMEYYVREFHVDGYRCDVGQLVPDDFWVTGINRIKKINPDVLMLNEGYVVDITAGETENGVFDTNYNFSWYYRMAQVMDGLADASALRAQWVKDFDYYRGLIGKCARFIDNHDFATDRPVRNELAWGNQGVECALVINHTIDGVPFIFNGTEVATSCDACMFASRFSKGVNAIEWSNLLLPEGRHRLELMKKLNDIHHNHEAAHKGELEFLESDQDSAIFAFERKCADKRLITIANVGSEKTIANVYAGTIGMEVLVSSDIEYQQVKDKLTITIGPKGYIVFAD